MIPIKIGNLIGQTFPVIFFPQEAEQDGDGTLDLEEFVKAFDKLFGLKGKVCVCVCVCVCV